MRAFKLPPRLLVMQPRMHAAGGHLGEHRGTGPRWSYLVRGSCGDRSQDNSSHSRFLGEPLTRTGKASFCMFFQTWPYQIGRAPSVCKAPWWREHRDTLAGLLEGLAEPPLWRGMWQSRQHYPCFCPSICQQTHFGDCTCQCSYRHANDTCARLSARHRSRQQRHGRSPTGRPHL